MKIRREYIQAVITKKGTRWVQGGHPWIYEAEVLGYRNPSSEELQKDSALPRLPFGIENGAIVDAVSENDRYLGSGFYSEKSKIRIRLISENANDQFDAEFWRRRIRYALDYRKAVMGMEDYRCCRLIYGETDGFPGLTVDRFSDLLSVQILSQGIERIRDILIPELVRELLHDGQEIRGVFLRNDVKIRALEGLPEGKGWYVLPDSGAPEYREIRALTADPRRSPQTEITENGIIYSVDVENGQKTGFFLDQKYNRLAVRRLAQSRRVLDCFTHTGSFALNAAAAGARSVTAVDISASAVAMAEKNAGRNGLSDRIDFVTADVFELLSELLMKREKPYDLIILDPPAFTKSRKTVSNAAKGYKEINLAALRILPRGGYLATASCSHFMDHARFEEMLREAAREAGVKLRLIEVRGPAPDHPVLFGVPETEYLKFYIFQVV